jgi:hypothetical protein
MWDILLRTQIVLNIHYSEDSPAEMYRICEAGSHGCVIFHEIGNGYKAILPGELQDQKARLKEVMEYLNLKL